ncbi:ATP-binding protein [Kitasatospora sp. NPDC004240]
MIHTDNHGRPVCRWRHRNLGGYGRSASCTVRAEPASVPALRRAAAELSHAWSLPVTARDAVGLIVSELAANAVLHSGGGSVTVGLVLRDGAVGIEVRDTGRWRPRAATGPATAEDCSGRGLEIVQSLSESVVVIRSPGGTRVLARIALMWPADRGGPLEPALPAIACAAVPA